MRRTAPMAATITTRASSTPQRSAPSWWAPGTVVEVVTTATSTTAASTGRVCPTPPAVPNPGR